jgi:hypothetical protein
MRVESFRDLLDWTSGYHLHLSQCFRQCAHLQKNERSAGRYLSLIKGGLLAR